MFALSNKHPEHARGIFLGKPRSFSRLYGPQSAWEPRYGTQASLGSFLRLCSSLHRFAIASTPRQSKPVLVSLVVTIPIYSTGLSAPSEDYQHIFRYIRGFGLTLLAHLESHERSLLCTFESECSQLEFLPRSRHWIRNRDAWPVISQQDRIERRSPHPTQVSLSHLSVNRSGRFILIANAMSESCNAHINLILACT